MKDYHIAFLFMFFQALIGYLKCFSNAIIDLVFPIECLGCGSEGEWICSDCFLHLRPKAGQYCFGCREPRQFGELCGKCKKTYYFDGIIIAGDYDNKFLAYAITTFKYKYVHGLANPLARFMEESIVSISRKSRILLNENYIFPDKQGKQAAEFFLELDADYVIIPVPLSRKRMKWRGFNQAEKLAGELSLYLGLEALRDALCRKGRSVQQAGLSEAERLENVIGKFECKPNLNFKNVLLVDDVITTGATLNECAKALKAKGAKTVWGLVVAKG